MKTYPALLCIRNAAACASALVLALSAPGQSTAPSTASPPEDEDDDLIELSPFTVEASYDSGYMASTTLAGTRLRTELRDIGSSVSVLTEEFLEDIGATDNQSALAYATNMEVGGLTGNYQNAPNTGSWQQPAETESHFSPNTNTRVRGLVSADNTRNYFRTNVAWDSYNVGRIDLLRGPNSILFGLGSPGGVINATTDNANLSRNSAEVGVVIDEFGSFRTTVNYNAALVKNELGVRIAMLDDNEKFQQDPAYDDEERLFLAAKYRPGALNSSRMGFEISVDYERGRGKSNRPRTAPPLDWVTPWIEPVSTRPIQLPAGTNFMSYPDGVIPAYTHFADQEGVTFLENTNNNFGPSLGSSADAFGPRLTVNALGASDDYWIQGRVWVEGVRLANGTVYYGNPQTSRRLFGYGNAYEDTNVRALNNFLVAQGHPFGNSYLPLQFTDPSVYDFYNKLLDGPNKREWSDFDQIRAVVSNTFFNRKVGYELSYFRENSTRGQTNYLSDVSRVYVDTHLEDIEGNPNPDFGRPYVQETTGAGNRVLESDVEGYRVSAYLEHDFADRDKGAGWLGRMLGRHVFNAAFSNDTSGSDSRGFSRFVIGEEFFEKSPNNPRFNNRTRVSLRYYLGDSLVGRSSMAGANIGNLSRFVMPEGGGTINLRYFDTTWTAGSSVLPNTRWVNPLGQAWEEAANPANYRGWTQGNYTIIDALSGNPGDYAAATGSARLVENSVDSKIFTWQGRLFNGLIVGTYGWREDESTSDSFQAPALPAPRNGADVSPEVYTLDNAASVEDELTVRSSNTSVVAHLNALPWLGDKLPLNVSVSYNKGENFNPSSGRRDVNGNFIAPPQGSTEEYGLVLSTKDNKYSLRVTKYETGVLNSTSVQIPNAIFRFNQFLSLNPREMINDIESGDLRLDYEALATRPSWSIDDQENIYGPAYRQFERDFAAAFPGFVSAWLVGGTYPPMDREAQFSPNFTNTEDNVSKGWEFEVTANPTRSLRVAANISKTKAERDNVPGDSTRAVYEFIQNAMYNPDGSKTNAGLMRDGYDWQNKTIADFWTGENWVQYGVVQQLNGQPAPELVEWRANVLANYSFQQGALRGWGVGGAYRFESGNAIGFPYYFDDAGTITANIQSPWKRESNDRVDLWVRHERKLWEGRINWSIQLHLFNAFGDDELIPVRANPDGVFANFRIQQGRSWRLSNTFRF